MNLLIGGVLAAAVALGGASAAAARRRSRGARGRLAAVDATVDSADLRNRSVARSGRARPPTWFARRLDAMALAVDPARVWWRACLTAAVLALVTVVGLGPSLGLVVLLAAGGVGALVLDLTADRADRLVDAGLPAVLDRIAAGLRAGLGLPAALAESVPPERGPLQRDLGALTGAVDAGVPLARGLQRWCEQRPTAGTRLASTALSVCAVAGGRSRPLDGVASSLRDHLAIERELRAVSAQVRASAVVLVALPWVFVGFSAAQDPEVLAFFTRGLLGVACLTGGLILDVGGAWIMARMVRSVR
jgi:tight adherence protein B